MLSEGQQVELTVEKPAAGGWMIARHLGEIVFVRGAIPGERVTAWVERAERRLAYAAVRDVVEPSPDRRDPVCELLCGGMLYAHIAYERQRTLKAEILQDAFARLGRHPLDAPPPVAGSPEHGYRMRARFHVAGPRTGFYREGTHQLCDAGATRQMQDAAVEAAAAIARGLHAAMPDAAASIAVTESLDGRERAAHVEFARAHRVDPRVLDLAAADAGLTGISASSAAGPSTSAGDPAVADPLSAIAGDTAQAGSLRRRAASFFQGNRYLLAPLVRAVSHAVPESGRVLDLYAGVGLFAVSLAALGRDGIVAVEGDRVSGADLRHNVRGQGGRVDARIGAVEDYISSVRPRDAGTIIVDPPRTGISKSAIAAVLALEARRIVYVSCDPATLARDARRVLDAGYALQSLQGFDLFPNTPHVEALAVFERL